MAELRVLNDGKSSRTRFPRITPKAVIAMIAIGKVSDGNSGTEGDGLSVSSGLEVGDSASDGWGVEVRLVVAVGVDVGCKLVRGVDEYVGVEGAGELVAEDGKLGVGTFEAAGLGEAVAVGVRGKILT